MSLALKAGALALVSLSLAACSASTATVATAAKTVDAICASEPAIYSAYVTVAVARGASEAKLARAAAAHAVISDTCTNRPTDIATAAARLATAYATIVAARAQIGKV